MSDSPGPVGEIRGSIAAQCPFCDGAYIIGYYEKDLPCVLHTIPTCRAFDENLDPGIFLKLAREKREEMDRNGIEQPLGPKFLALKKQYDKRFKN